MHFLKDRKELRGMGRYLLALIIISVFLSGCGKKQDAETIGDIRVESRTVDKGTLEIRSDYIGSLVPNITVDVIPLVAGTILEVNVKEGDQVKAGDLLARIDDTSADFNVRSAEDAVNSAIAGKNAAQTQTDSAKIQADSSVKTLKKTLKNYEDSLATASSQLKKLRNSKKNLEKSLDETLKAYTLTRTRYKTAETLLIQYGNFLDDYPDCRTTAGLTAAASGLSSDPADYQTDPSGISIGEDEESASGDDTSSSAKQEQALSLLNALNKVGLTVEYLTNIGLSSLKEDLDDCETSYSGASSGVSQIESAIESLKTSISQLKAQISATKDSLNSARKMASLASGGTDVYDAQIAAAETGVDAAKYQKDLYRLTTPIDGIVDTVNVKKDGMASQGYAAFTISEKESMIASFYVTEEVKNFLKIGDPVELVLEDHEEDESIGNNPVGAITLVSPTADSVKGLFKVEAEIVTTGQKALSGGTSVKLSLITNAVDDQLLIPYDAVYYDEGTAYVYKLEGEAAYRTDIETGLFNADQIVVTDGLSEGDSIITTWASGLKDGAKVKVVDAEEED